MTDHPSNLHAAANCWSLRRSWADLRDSRDIAATVQDTDGLRSPTYGQRTASGGHADPVTNRPLSPGAHYGQVAETIRDNVDQARWLATSALRHTGMPIGPALATLTRVIPDLTPDVAHEVGRYLAHADKAARRALRLGTDHLVLPTNPKCPACGVRMMRARTSNPDTSAWPVICGAGCQCTGAACPCGMTVRARRVPHIWPGATLDLDAAPAEVETTSA